MDNRTIGETSQAAVKIAVFVPDGGGHHASYVRIWLKYIVAKGYSSRFRFIVTNSLLLNLQVLDQAAATLLLEMDHLILREKDTKDLYAGHPFRQGWKRWCLLRSLAINQPEIGHFFVAYIDHIQLLLAIGFRLPNSVKISGIFFRPQSSEIYGKGSGSILERIAFWRRQVTYWGLLANRRVSALFCLDRYFVADQIAKSRRGCLRYLPDPICIDDVRAVPQFPEAVDSLRPSPLRLLFFGAIAERKGILKFLEGLRQMERPEGARFKVTLLGRIDSTIRDAVLMHLGDLDSSWISTEIRDQFVSDIELAERISECHCVVAPYQRFVGSSGVILWAAAFGKPVLTQDWGLIGREVSEFGLGLTVDTTKPVKISEGLVELLGRYESIRCAAAEGGKQFVRTHDSNTFAETTIEQLLSFGR